MSGPTRFRILAIVTVINFSKHVFTLQYRFGEILFPENQHQRRRATNQIDSAAFLEKIGNKKTDGQF